MSDKPTRYCTITFMDGASMDLKFKALKSDHDPTTGSLLKDLNEVRNLVLEVDGNLTIIPMANVRTVEVSPAPSAIRALVVHAKRR